MQTKYNTTKCLANYIVISIVPVLFFISIALGYAGVIPLKVPIHSVVLIGFILFIFLLFVKHNANYSICKIRASYGSLRVHLEKKLEENSLSIYNKTKSLLDIEVFLNNYYSDVRNDNFASVASSIFPMLGILGTFIAIAISMPNFSVSNNQALDHEISMLLSGVGSAFFASIYGILLSLIWTYFEKRGLSKVKDYFSSIKSDFSYSVWSKEELLIYKYTQYDLKENRFLSALRETFSLDFIEKLNAQHVKSYEKMMHETNESFSQISTNLRTVSHEISNTLSQMNVSNSYLLAQEHIDKSIVEFTDATQSFEKSIKIHSAQMNNSLNRTFDKIDNEIGQIVTELADFATHVSLESSEVQKSISEYHEIVAKQLKER